jgi:DNA-binding CsgD family transcriptional regulator
MIPSDSLLERESEVAALEALLEDARRGSGRVAVVEGPAGIGKTELLGVLRARAVDFEVCMSCGGELEAGLSYGIARQLLEPVIARSDPDDREALLSGPARPAGAALGVRPAEGWELDEPNMCHALQGVVRRLGDNRPLLLLIDDVQWADPPSLRWLAYLSRRLDALPVMLAMSVRTTEPDSDVVGEIVADIRSVVLRLSPLSATAVTSIVRAAYSGEAEESFCQACYTATGGNPFFVHELVRAATAADVKPVASQADRLAALTPQGLLRALSVRLQRLPAPAPEVAKALAVLGGGANLRVAAALAGVDVAGAVRAADTLIEAGILNRAREFLHPIIRTVVYEALPPGERALTHGRAARLLVQEHGRLDKIANHLLAAEPTGDDWVVETLRRAAAAESSPERRTAYLRRALVEPAADGWRSEVLLDLGQAEAAQGSPEALEHLRDAMVLADDRLDRARAAKLLGRGLWLLDRRDEAAGFYRQAVAELGEDRTGPAHDLLLEVEAEWLRWQGLSGWDGTELIRLRRAAEAADTSGRRALLATISYVGTFAGFPASEVATMAERALEGDRLFAERPDAATCFYPIWALEWAEQLDSAKQHAQLMLEEARNRGWVTREALAGWAVSDIAYRRGAVADADAVGQATLSIVLDHRIEFMLPVTVAVVLNVLVERTRYDDGDRILAETRPERITTTKSSLAMFRHARGRLHAARGRLDAAADDVSASAELLRRSAHDHPAYVPWRSTLAMLRYQSDDVVEARRLAGEEVAMARAYGAPGVLGVALRASALVGRAEEQSNVLGEAVAALGSSPRRLELARALVDLGAALRRCRQPSAARDVLRRGVDLAQRCGATGLVERAREELAAAGGRPRRLARFGVDALTPSELRVAHLAAGGLTNPEISRALFVNVKTVEKHLGQVYQKLQVDSRRRLRDLLPTSSVR